MHHAELLFQVNGCDVCCDTAGCTLSLGRFDFASGLANFTLAGVEQQTINRLELFICQYALYRAINALVRLQIIEMKAGL